MDDAVGDAPALKVDDTGRVSGMVKRSQERVTGIEPAPPAWKAGALPLSYTRERASHQGTRMRVRSPRPGVVAACSALTSSPLD